MSEKPVLKFTNVKKNNPAPGPVGWGRPTNWPRIDLINMYGLDHDENYFIIRKPEDTVNHGFVLYGTNSYAQDGGAKPTSWYMVQVEVSDDGKTVTEIESTKQSANIGASISFIFPESDPEGTIYAVKTATNTPGYFLHSLKDPGSQSRCCILEAIIHCEKSMALSFSSGQHMPLSPMHIAYYACKAGISAFGFRSMRGARYIEMRDSSKYIISRETPRLSLDWPTLDCDDTVTFEINNSRGSVMQIGAGWFQANSDGEIPWLDKVTYNGKPADFTGADYQVSDMFSNAVRLKKMTLPANFGSKATSLSSLFSGCLSLEKVDFPAGFGAEATSLANMFAQCGALSEITFPAQCGAKATDISTLFANGCYNLRKVTLPDGFGSVATNMANVFSAANSLTTLHLPSGFGQAATNASGIFTECNALTTITGNPNFKVSVDLHFSTKLTHDSLMVIINGLQTVTTKQTLTLGATNLAKLTDEEKKVATDKGWTLA